MTNLGTFKAISNHKPGGYLQGTTGDEASVHASNAKVNEEETWFLFEIDQSAHTYALMVWRTGRFLSRHGGGKTNHRVQANAAGIGPSETWKLLKGEPYGHPGSLAFQSVVDDGWLCAKEPKTNADGEPGEVYVDFGSNPNSGADWEGWWYTTPTGEPSPGKDPWNTLGGMAAGVVNKMSPADIAKLIAVL